MSRQKKEHAQVVCPTCKNTKMFCYVLVGETRGDSVFDSMVCVACGKCLKGPGFRQSDA